MEEEKASLVDNSNNSSVPVKRRMSNVASNEDLKTLNGSKESVIASRDKIEQYVHNNTDEEEEEGNDHDSRICDNNNSSSSHGVYQENNLTTVCATLKSEYNLLRSKYLDLVVAHGLTSQQLISAQEESLSLQNEFSRKARDVFESSKEVDSLRSHLAQIQRKLDETQRRADEARQLFTQAQQQRNDALNRLNKTINEKIETRRELARLTKERNDAVKEYNLVMSERNSVHEEMERLQEECRKTKERVKVLTLDKKRLSDENEYLRKQFLVVLLEKERLFKDTPVSGDVADCPKQLPGWRSSGRHSLRLSEYSMSNAVCLPFDTSDTVSCTSFNFQAPSDTHLEGLQMQVVRLQRELETAREELYFHQLKQRWSLKEKLRAALEKASVTTLCNQYRRERERALMDLAKALTDMNEVREEKERIVEELKQYKAKLQGRPLRAIRWPKSFRHSIHGTFLGHESSTVDHHATDSEIFPSSSASSVDTNSIRSTMRSKLSGKFKLFSRRSNKKVSNLDFESDAIKQTDSEKNCLVESSVMTTKAYSEFYCSHGVSKNAASWNIPETIPEKSDSNRASGGKSRKSFDSTAKKVYQQNSEHLFVRPSSVSHKWWPFQTLN